jgi:hypothetical protein
MVEASWEPHSEADLLAAVQEGLLEEGHHLDLKREISSGKAANTELARDLASFSIDGGILLIGIDESTAPPSLYPVPLKGLAERIELVARSRVDPPLLIRSTEITTSLDDRQGYLVIRAPASPLAPHMVDHRYWGRDDKTKYRLSEAEVARLYQLRQTWTEDAIGILRKEMERDPTLADPKMKESSDLAHLFIVAEPIPGHDPVLLPVIEGEGWPQRLWDLVHRRAASRGIRLRGFEPGFDKAEKSDRRAGGWALTSYDFDSGRVFSPDARERRLIELEIGENGSLRLFCDRASDRQRDGGGHLIIDTLVVGLCFRVLAVASQVGEDSGHWGAWGLACGITRLKGTSASSLSGRNFEPAMYSDGEYLRATRSTTDEMERTPGAVAERLVGPLLRSLGSRALPQFAKVLDASEPAAPTT